MSIVLSGWRHFHLRSAWSAIAALGLVLVVDGIFKSLQHPPLWVAGPLDEGAHLATTWLVLIAIGLLGRPGVGWALVATVAIDLDHLPQLLGWFELGHQNARPVTHALWLPVLLVGLSVWSPRWRRLAGFAALGILLHLLRDAATGGLTMWWPIRPDMTVDLPYWGYIAILLACTIAGVTRDNARDC